MSGVLNGLIGSYLSPGSYESIATILLPTANATVVFSSIPSTYQHLQLRISSRDTRSALVGNDVRIQLNGDTLTNYSRHIINGSGNNSTATSSGTATTEMIIISNAEPAANAAANIFGAIITDILDYANTNKFKTVRSFGGYTLDAISGSSISFNSGNWRSSAAINSIKVYNSGPVTFSANSIFSLYGIKG